MDQTMSRSPNAGGDPNTSGEGHVPINALPVAHLRILAQQELEQTDYPIYEGESSIGRGVDCDLSIEATSLSRKHAVILVEGGTHFVQDNGSRNKTFRKTTQLRPNAFYELSNACDLTFADVVCQYYFGPPPEVSVEGEGEGGEGEGEGSYEQTQAYLPTEECDAVPSGEGGGEDMEEDTEQEGAEEGGRATGGRAADCEESGMMEDTHCSMEEQGEEMGCEPTLPYNLGGEEEEDDDMEGESADVPSPPLLTGMTRPDLGNSATDSSTCEVTCASGDVTCTSGMLADEDEEETDIEEPAEEEANGGGGRRDMGIGAVAATGIQEEAFPEDSKALDTGMAQDGDLSESLDNGVTSVNERGVSSPPVETSPGSVKPSEATESPATPPGPFNAELAHSSDESTAVEDEDGESPVATKIPMATSVPMATTAAIEEDSEPIDSILPPPKAGSHSKQKNIFSLVAGRGKGKRGGRGRGRGRGRKVGTRNSTESLDSEIGTELKECSSVDSDKTRRSRRNGGPLPSRTRAEASSKPHTKSATDEDAMEVDKVSSDSPNITTPGLTTPGLTTSGEGEVTPAAELHHTPPPAVVRGGRGRKGAARARGRGKGASRTSQRQSKAISAAESETPVIPTGVLESPNPESGTNLHDQTEKEEESPGIGLPPNKRQGGAMSHDSSPQDPVAMGKSPAQPGPRKRGRGAKVRGGRGKPARSVRSSPSMDTQGTPKKSSPSTLRQYFTPVRASPTSAPPLQDTEDKPKVMFTGMIDKKGEKKVKEMGGELVDSVFHCTHLVTDKVRRTVKFLCCLSRGCMIVSDHWLDECGKAGYFLPAKSYLVKDKAAEKQHNFSLIRSHETAKHQDLLSGYVVHLTPSLKPDRDQMTDIIKCSGGEAVQFESPVLPGDRVVIISCEDDLSMCKDSMEAGVPVFSSEFILGGVLKQELDLKSHLMSLTSSDVSSRKRKAKEVPAAVKRRRK